MIGWFYLCGFCILFITFFSYFRWSIINNRSRLFREKMVRYPILTHPIAWVVLHSKHHFTKLLCCKILVHYSSFWSVAGYKVKNFSGNKKLKKSGHKLFFKVAVLTLWFNLSSSNRAERQRREARGIPPNLTYHNPAPCCLPRLVEVTCASLSLRSAVTKPDAAYFSAALNRPPRSKRHQAWWPFN